MSNLPLFIIIPAKKEEEVIIETLNEVKRCVKSPHSTIVVVDYSPSDKTKEAVENYMKKDKTVEVIVNRSKIQSFANALKMGFSKIKEGAVVPVMADMSDELKLIDRMYTLSQKNWDIVCGSRYMKGGKKIGGPILQSILSKIVCLSLHYITNVPTKDVSNSFKMYNKKVLENITIDSTKGVEISMDMTMHAYFNGARITELPTRWIGRKQGKSKFKILNRFPRYLSIYSFSIGNTIKKYLTNNL